MNNAQNPLPEIQDWFRKVLTWRWTKGLVYWIVVSAGTMSECVFLVASIWMSINASEHKLVRMFLSELQSQQISFFAISAYIVLPVCILPLAIINTRGHFKTWRYSKKRWHPSGLWFLLYLIPTATFLIIDVCIIGNSNTVNYTLPDYLIQARSIMAYTYGLVAILYHYAGQNQEAERLQEKDVIISQYADKVSEMSQQVETLKAEMTQQIGTLKAEIVQQKTLLAEQKSANKRIVEEINKSDDAALEAYGPDCINWLRSGAKSVLVDEIIRYTGHSRKKINNALKGGNLHVSTRNKDYVLISSLVEWLKSTPVPSGKDRDNDRDTDTLPISNGHANETITLDEYPEILV